MYQCYSVRFSNYEKISRWVKIGRKISRRVRKGKKFQEGLEKGKK